MSASGIIDTHCHLDDSRFNEDREAVVDRALAAGVSQLITIGTGDGPPDLEVAIRIAEQHEPVFASVGVHPHDAAKAEPGTAARVRALLDHPKVLLLGEIGLDYHYDFSPRDVQQAVFIEQLSIAREAQIPIAIHTREAWDDTFNILEKHWAPAGIPGIMHCFSGGPAEAERALAMGFYLSFGGVVTFPKAVELQQAARIAPADRILVETDAPYLAPVPHRGKRNEPAFITGTVSKLAALRGTTPEAIVDAASTNFQRLCGLPQAKGNG